jgi:hypothetical protein
MILSFRALMYYIAIIRRLITHQPLTVDSSQTQLSQRKIGRRTEGRGLELVMHGFALSFSTVDGEAEYRCEPKGVIEVQMSLLVCQFEQLITKLVPSSNLRQQLFLWCDRPTP